MASAPIILPGAWALGDGVALDSSSVPTSLQGHPDPMSGVWSSILDTVSVALHMVGWKWDCSHAASRMRVRRFSGSSASALETLESEFSDSDCSEESWLERSTQVACSGLSKQSYGKED
ncbi:hypothetical protein VaNZ11_003692 [Volvox africanus]|uniref:Uncharacterized protein n=1 Tax=Volvox africanus TaxID=51714 RepID=A0ABQ5RUT3_9CHLO|nr:hypothetical protein VaNZ11_003692 [Volvox africanus]